MQVIKSVLILKSVNNKPLTNWNQNKLTESCVCIFRLCQCKERPILQSVVNYCRTYRNYFYTRANCKRTCDFCRWHSTWMFGGNNIHYGCEVFEYAGLKKKLCYAICYSTIVELITATQYFRDHPYRTGVGREVCARALMAYYWGYPAYLNY